MTGAEAATQWERQQTTESADQPGSDAGLRRSARRPISTSHAPELQRVQHVQNHCHRPISTQRPKPILSQVTGGSLFRFHSSSPPPTPPPAGLAEAMVLVVLGCTWGSMEGLEKRGTAAMLW